MIRTGAPPGPEAVEREEGGEPAAEGPTSHAPPRSMAVLPFTNVSADPDNEYSSDGITDELIGALTRLDGLPVAARTSAYAYKAVAHQWLGRAWLAVGNSEEAIEAQRTARDLLGEDPESLASLGHALAAGGFRSEAEDLWSRLDELSGSRYVAPYWRGLLLIGLGEHARALEELERAFRVRVYWLLFLSVDPLFDELRSRFPLPGASP